MNKSKITMLRTALLGIFILVATINVSYGQTKIDKIDQLIGKYAEYGQFNGSILVAEKGKVLYKKSFGLANMEWDIPNQTNTKFRLASITKQFTAMLIVQLASENKIALDVPISTYLPDYPKENGDRITIHQLLTHTSGIPNYTSFPNYRDMMRNPKSPVEIVHLFADSTLNFVPGEKHEYSNSGYALLGVIIEKVTGKSFEEVLQDKILTPLKMNATGYDHHDTVMKKRASGYYKKGTAYVNANYIDMSMAFTAGGIYSTVEDLYLWDQALYTEKLLPKKYMDLIFEKHSPVYGRYYGYGWEIGEMGKGRSGELVQVVNHSGFINGFNTLITRIPEDKSSIILLNNTSGAPLYQMSRAISGILYDKPYNLPKKSIADSLLEWIEKDGLSAALSHYEAIKNSEDYNLNENEVNMTGYHLLQSERVKEAAAIFKLNIEAFPKSSNAYDSYGEALMILGNKAEAIKNYKKSVKLNPDNENGVKVLKDLGVEMNITKKEDLYFLEANDTWRKEIFRFPLRFAPDINYEGAEDARFPVGWEKKDSSTYWSYVFAWNIDHSEKLTKGELESGLQMYFDGLMHIKDRTKDDKTIQKTTVLLNQKNINGKPVYQGAIKTFDAFFTKESMALNVHIDQHYCKQKKKTIILFRFSPKPFGNAVWHKLEEVKLPTPVCNF